MAWRFIVAGDRKTAVDGYIIVSGSREQVQELYTIENGNRVQFYPEDKIKAWSDTLSASDTIVIDKLKEFTLSDTAALSGQWSLTKENRNTTKSWSDTLTATDQIVLVKSKTISLVDSATLGESWPQPTAESRSHSESWSESITATDSVSVDRTKTINISDTASLSETWSLTTESRGPSDLSVTFNSGDCAMDLSWTADGDVQQDIYECQGSSCDPQNGTLVQTVSASTSQYSIGKTGVADGTDFSYQIVSSNGSTSVVTATKGPCI